MKNTLFVKEIIFNSKGQLFLKKVFLLRNNNLFSRVLKLKKEKRKQKSDFVTLN